MLTSTAKDLFFLLGFVFQIGGVIVAGVWFISRIKGTTDLLNQSICGLRDTVADLKAWVRDLDSKMDDTHDRVMKLETRLCAYQEEGERPAARKRRGG